MRVFVTGASGFVGSAVVQDLLAAGHRVLALARSDANVEMLTKVGVDVHRGSLEDHASLRAAAAACDGVIHCAFIHDFAKMAASGEVDQRAIKAIGAELRGAKPFVVTSALGVLPAGTTTEADTAEPGTHRTVSDQVTRDVGASLLRLPPSVHGDGDYGFVPGLIETAREKGISGYVGDGTQRWAAAHRLDAATLYRLALERGAAATYHAAAEEGVATRAIAETIGRKLGIPVQSIPAEDAAAHFGWLGRFFARDVSARSEVTRRALDWTPRQPGLIADLENGRYFD